MKNKHKYFRNLRHKDKLEGKGQGWRTYWSHTMYYTKEPDTAHLIRDSAAAIYWRMSRYDISFEEAVQKEIEWKRRTGTGNSYVYYEKPEVPYTIHKVQTDPRYSRRRKDYQKYSNKLVRQAWKQRGEIYQHCEYKKLFGIAWELD